MKIGDVVWYAATGDRGDGRPERGTVCSVTVQVQCERRGVVTVGAQLVGSTPADALRLMLDYRKEQAQQLKERLECDLAAVADLEKQIAESSE